MQAPPAGPASWVCTPGRAGTRHGRLVSWETETARTSHPGDTQERAVSRQEGAIGCWGPNERQVSVQRECEGR